MWTTIGFITLSIIFVAYMVVCVKLQDNFTLVCKCLLTVVEVADQEKFLHSLEKGKIIKRYTDSAIKIYRKSVPLMALLLLWPIGPYLRRKNILSAYNNGKPQLEWDQHPKLWDDLVKGYAPKNRSLSQEEIKGFVRVLDYIL